VRDVATLYRRIVEHAPAGQTINLCSGRGHSLQEVIDMAGGLVGYRISVKVNSSFVRANEVKRLVGSPFSLAGIASGFSPRPLLETLEWMLGRPH
jgi:GDP-6-deoxy-D-talose 4-dehydrogenase